jgi:hypothetical protein
VHDYALAGVHKLVRPPPRPDPKSACGAVSGQVHEYPARAGPALSGGQTLRVRVTLHLVEGTPATWQRIDKALANELHNLLPHLVRRGVLTQEGADEIGRRHGLVRAKSAAPVVHKDAEVLAAPAAWTEDLGEAGATESPAARPESAAEAAFAAEQLRAAEALHGRDTAAALDAADDLDASDEFAAEEVPRPEGLPLK